MLGASQEGGGARTAAKDTSELFARGTGWALLVERLLELGSVCSMGVGTNERGQGFTSEEIFGFVRNETKIPSWAF